MSWIDYVSSFGPAIIALLAVIIAIVGWFVSSNKARSNDKAKEARAYRIKMCRSIIRFHKYFFTLAKSRNKVSINDERLFELFNNMADYILLCGNDEENALLRKLSSNFKAAETNIGKKNVDEALSHKTIYETADVLRNIAINGFREELSLEKITAKELSELG